MINRCRQRLGGAALRSLVICVFGVVGVVGVAGCGGSTESSATTGFATYAEDFIERTHSLLPHIAVGLGKHQYDGVQTNFSAAAIALQETHFATALVELERFELTEVDERYERDLLLWYANSHLFALQGSRLHKTNIASYFDAMTPNVYVNVEYAPPHARLQALVKHTRNLPNLARQLQANLDMPLPKPHVARALAFFSGMVEYYEDVVSEEFAAVADVNLQQQLGDASLAAVHALRNLLVWLQEQEPRAQDNFRLGADLFQGLLLQVHHTTMTLEQFKVLGEKELARNSQALKVACAELDSTLTLPDCVAQGAAAQHLLASAHERWLASYQQGLPLPNASRPLRAVVRSGAFTQGWAHYSEELMWEVKPGQAQPLLRVWQLQNALLANIRYLCSYGLHVEAISTQACEQMFVEQAFQSSDNARQQAAQGTYDPNYFSYTLHKLLIRQLRKKFGAHEGSAEILTAFHAELLGLGAPPTPLAAKYIAPGQ